MFTGLGLTTGQLEGLTKADSMFVLTFLSSLSHRALYTYEGNSNDLILASSGGKRSIQICLHPSIQSSIHPAIHLSIVWIKLWATLSSSGLVYLKAVCVCLCVCVCVGEAAIASKRLFVRVCDASVKGLLAVRSALAKSWSPTVLNDALWKWLLFH